VRTATGIALVLLGLVVLTGCGSTEKGEAGDSPLVAQCVHRMLERAEGEPKRVVRDYLRRTYCEPFAKSGWVHADGTISIRAHEWLLGAGTCEKADNTTTLPCDSRTEQEAPLLECGLLHFVRRSEGPPLPRRPAAPTRQGELRRRHAARRARSRLTR
jgi:hypothetical protein